jgi:protoporphyrin/coproporphyrin ferrochelatase
LTEPLKRHYDALLVISFGGPEKREDVIPFLENVLRGKPVPRERLLEVAEHYYHFGGVSPINAQVREFIDALRTDLDRAGIRLPIYWGNRNWHPMLGETLRQMKQDGVKQALGFVTSAYSSYSGCRQYRENIEVAQAEVGPGAPVIDKLRVFYNHPGFISAIADRIRTALEQLPGELRADARFAFTAHSIPLSMSASCDYVTQLNEAARLIASDLQIPSDRWQLVYQSRSGRPGDPWLEPDIGDHIRQLHSAGTKALVIAPIGFISDHMEVIFDLDEEARNTCNALGIAMTRAGTVGAHPDFVACIRELIEERLGLRDERRAIGQFGPNHDFCPVDCCQYVVAKRPGTP